MRAINKGNEPPSLTVHRKTQHSNYDNYADKDDLRSVLVAEQRGLCCYCMCRIRSDRTEIKIEHWQCQARFPEKQLVYRNMLGACLGGIGQPRHLQHCDTKKADWDLLWNPAEPDHHIETRLSYEYNGTIGSEDPEFDRQLNEVLNLNISQIKNNRKGVIDGILDWWKRTPARIRYKRLQQMKQKYSEQTGELTPYVQVAVWWLDKLLAKASA